MNKWSVVIGGATGMGWIVANTLLAESSSCVLIIDSGNVNESYIGRDDLRLKFIESEATSIPSLDSHLGVHDTIASVVLVAPPFYRGADAQDPLLGFSVNFKENVSGVIYGFLEFLSRIHVRFSNDASIVLVSSSLASRVAVTNASLDYHVAKAVTESVTKYLAVKLAPQVRVNAVAPGLIARNANSALLTDPTCVKAISGAVPLSRPANQSEIAALIAYLLSEQSSYLTGVTIPIDGGQALLETYQVAKSMFY